MWKNPYIVGTIALCILAACGKGILAEYTLTLSPYGTEKHQELFSAVERVVQRRIASFKMDATATVSPSGDDSATLALAFNDAQSKTVLTEGIERPFSFEIKSLATGITDLSKASLSDWRTTGVTNKDLLWVQAIGDRATGKVGVELLFSDEGRKRLSAVIATLAKEGALKNAEAKPILGIFVRDVLISSLQVTDGILDSRIIVSGIPSPAIAQVFADDVNVGLHVTFTPR